MARSGLTQGLMKHDAPADQRPPDTTSIGTETTDESHLGTLTEIAVRKHVDARDR